MFTLNHIVPWGRSFDEYCRMFALTEEDLAGKIIGCGDGPASFNAEATRRIFPLLALDGKRSRYINSVVSTLDRSGYDVSIRRMPYEFQRAGNEMMRIAQLPV